MIEEEERESIQKGTLANTAEISQILDSVLGEEGKEQEESWQKSQAHIAVINVDENIDEYIDD